MNRLTTNKDTSQMGMLELAYNSCHIKNGLARYRDFENDVDARVLTRELLKKYADGDDAFIDDNNFDEEMLENLMYGTETIEGLIAVFYRNLWAMADIREELKAYEDAAEQGLLLRLPCKVGDVVWDIYCGKPYAYKITGYSFGTAEDYIDGPVKEDEIVCYCTDSTGSITGSFVSSVIGKTVFLTKEEAEQASKQMGEWRMTENEAIEFLKGKYPSWGCDEDEYENAITAIKALEEIQQYRAIGTIEEFKALKEKSVAKKPKSNKVIVSHDSYAYCPHCKHCIELFKPSHCDRCGGELDWQ